MPALALIMFHIKRLHVEAKDPKSLKKSDKTDITFSWATATETNDPLVRVLTFGVSASASQAEKRVIPEIDVLIAGKFRLAADAPHDKLEEILLVNGSSILYGTLRGVLAGLSGAMVNGQFILPTVDMAEIVQGMLKAQKSQNKPKVSGSQQAKTAGGTKVKNAKTVVDKNKKSQ